eukprot:4745778-Heterocapsa_arctica.AAC.1
MAVTATCSAKRCSKLRLHAAGSAARIRSDGRGYNIIVVAATLRDTHTFRRSLQLAASLATRQMP